MLKANGDSGFCTSPRPESNQSSHTNGHSNTAKEESQCYKKEEDPQEERVPCEFCGDLRIKETIMRHQVYILMFMRINLITTDNIIIFQVSLVNSNAHFYHFSDTAA